MKEIVTTEFEPLNYAEVIHELDIKKHLANLKRKRTNNAKVLTFNSHKVEKFLNTIYANTQP